MIWWIIVWCILFFKCRCGKHPGWDSWWFDWSIRIRWAWRARRKLCDRRRWWRRKVYMYRKITNTSRPLIYSNSVWIWTRAIFIKTYLHFRFLLVNPLAKRANYNPSFNSMLRLDKKASHYNPSFNSMLRLDKKGMKTHQGFANMLRLDKKANYNPAFNSMLRLDKRTPYRNSNFAGMLRLDKKAGSYGPSFASNMLRLDKKAVYNPGFNSMLRLDKKYSPNNFNAFSNQLRLDKRSFKSSLRNFGLLRLDA